jgi:hypothetical protein
LHTTTGQSQADFCWIEAALQEFERLVREGIPTTKPTEIKDSRLDASGQTGAEAQP